MITEDNIKKKINVTSCVHMNDNEKKIYGKLTSN